MGKPESKGGIKLQFNANGNTILQQHFSANFLATMKWKHRVQLIEQSWLKLVKVRTYIFLSKLKLHRGTQEISTITTGSNSHATVDLVVLYSVFVQIYRFTDFVLYSVFVQI